MRQCHTTVEVLVLRGSCQSTGRSRTLFISVTLPSIVALFVIIMKFSVCKN